MGEHKTKFEMKFYGLRILALVAAVYAGSFEEKDNCRCVSDTSDSLITIKCQLPKTINQTSEKSEDKCSSRPRECYDIKHADGDAQSGIYRIYPEFNRPQGFLVRCDQVTDGGGWTIIQNRENGEQDFYLGWDDYVQGFGALHQEFWMGLQLLHELTRFNKFDLRFDLGDFDDNKAYATYKKFSVGDSDGYVLNFNKTSYVGNAGDSLAGHHNMRFSTKDKEQDIYPAEHCAQLYTGGFWYYRCHQVNINGQYLKGAYSSNQYAKGMVWNSWKGYNYSLKTTQMKFRPDYIKN